ncbi:MAG: type IX secretion system PorP/SprF family membrane protein [Polaribacter sp.]|jgi:type IX secretion system PorP/SprF family membrane protein
MNKYVRHAIFYYLITGLLGVCCVQNSYAQDIHFSQFFAAPLLVNPAFSGLYHGDFRITGNVRQQWKSISEPFTTSAIGADYQFYRSNGDRISAGMQISSDEAGVGTLKTTQTYVVGAYHKSVGLNDFHGGLQFGYVEQGVDIKKFSFPNQFDRDLGQFNSQNDALPNGESNLQEKTQYIDVAIGFAWSRDFGQLKPIVGFSIYHLNFPHKTLTENDEARAKPRPVITYGGIYTLNQRYYLMPLFKYTFQTKSSDLLFGSNVARVMPRNKFKLDAAYAGMEFRTGVGRNTDASIFMLGLIFKKLRVGMSYDFNISSLRTSSSYRGATEISIIYTGLSTQLDRAHIPCNRY